MNTVRASSLSLKKGREEARVLIWRCLMGGVNWVFGIGAQWELWGVNVNVNRVAVHILLGRRKRKKKKERDLASD